VEGRYGMAAKGVDCMIGRGRKSGSGGCFCFCLEMRSEELPMKGTNEASSTP